MFRSPSYLIRNRYSYCLRIIVPKDLQARIGRIELRHSLHTGYLALAKQKAMVLAGGLHMLFNALRSKEAVMGKLLDVQIQQMINKHVRKTLKAWDERRLEDGNIYEGDTQDDVDELEDLIGTTMHNLRQGFYKSSQNTVNQILQDENVTVEPDSSEYIKLCRELQKAEVKMFEVERNRTIGVYSDDIEKTFPLSDKENDRKKSPDTQSVSLKKLMDEYWKKNEGGWKPRTKTGYEVFKRRILDYFGAETLIDTIDYSAMEKFRDEIKEKGNRGNSLSIKTVNMHLEFYHGMFSLAVKTKRMGNNPVEGLILADKRNSQNLRSVFDNDDLKKLFHSPGYLEDKHLNPSWFWVPLLALYTGARLEEICQFYVDDIKQIDGVWVIDINESRPDQSVKTSERRLIPLHPMLTDDLNFLCYISRLEDQSGRVFPELKRVNNRYGHGFGKWFGDYKTRCGIESDNGSKVFHSFRHLVIDHLVQKEVPGHQIAMLVGHKDAKITTGRYGKKFNPKMLLEKVVLKLDFDLDLSHLKQEFKR